MGMPVDVETDMRENSIYNFMQTQNVQNFGKDEIVCGAELESTHFEITTHGETTKVQVGLTITYENGVSERRMMAQKYNRAPVKSRTENKITIVKNTEEIGVLASLRNITK